MFDEFNREIRERIDELHCKVGKRFDELPLAAIICKMVDNFYFKVGKTIDNLYLKICKVLYDLDFSRQKSSVSRTSVLVSVY